MLKSSVLALLLIALPVVSVAAADEGGLAVAADTSGGWQHHGTKALSFGLPAAGGASAGMMYFLDGNTAIDLDFISSGFFDLGHHPDPMSATGDSTTNLTFDFTLGYRMYKIHEGDTSFFWEPALNLGTDTSNFGDDFHAGIAFTGGIEHKFADHFSITGAVGLAMDFTNKFKEFDLRSFSTGLFANFYWE